MTEQKIEQALIEKLCDLKYTYRKDIYDRASLEQNFREKFQSLNRVQLTDAEFDRLLLLVVTPDVFAAARHLRERNSFERDDGTPLYYTLVNIKDWCKNDFEVINQLRINTDYSHHRYDVILLINGVPVVQIELKTLAISPRRAMQQIVDYKNDPGNGYSKTLLCFLQLFIVSNRSDTWYFANNNNRHFSFNAEERFLPLYQFADEANNKITHLDVFADIFLAKCTLGEMISRYMVLVASEQKLMMMRPYQVYAVQAIVDCIHQHCGNGYIWHTTGSGKTLTSFKASTLLKDNPDRGTEFLENEANLIIHLKKPMNCPENQTSTEVHFPQSKSNITDQYEQFLVGYLTSGGIMKRFVLGFDGTALFPKWLVSEWEKKHHALSELEIFILAMARINGQTTAGEILDRVQLLDRALASSASSVTRMAKALVEKDLLRMEGSGGGAYYVARSRTPFDGLQDDIPLSGAVRSPAEPPALENISSIFSVEGNNELRTTQISLPSPPSRGGCHVF